MHNAWSEQDADAFANAHNGFSREVALQGYATALLGSDDSLALHGGGNTSVKTTLQTILGEARHALFVKSSGVPMRGFTPDRFVALDLDFLRQLRRLDSLDDNLMEQQLRLHLILDTSLRPSIETLLHAFLPHRHIDHTHPDQILALTNRSDGEQCAREALGEDVIVIPYARVGFDLACRVAESFERHPGSRGAVIAHHGLVTWGDEPRAAFERTLTLVRKANEFLDKKRSRRIERRGDFSAAREQYDSLAPVIRGVLSPPSNDQDNPFEHVILAPICDRETCALLALPDARSLLGTTPLTPDYLIRTRTLPLWLDVPSLDNKESFRKQLSEAVDAYKKEYRIYIKRAAGEEFSPDESAFFPRIICIPGLGIVCAGSDAPQAEMIRDITIHAVATKERIHETGGVYRGLSEDHLFDMEFRSLQRAKLGPQSRTPLKGSVAVVTGCAGAIGSGICEALLGAGCHVALTDLPGGALDEMGKSAEKSYPGRVMSVALDVTSPQSVFSAFNRIAGRWGGIDIVVVNAGIALVSPLADMDIEKFRKLELVNIEGTLLSIKEASRVFKIQNTGGDIILISTKNVFAPGAKFGAYSATKAAAHQLARIAALELADSGVRVNMVAPDAVFSHGTQRSGLWAEVGPDRMKARGLDEKGLEEYYRSRNLLKAGVTAEHVAHAVLFFITHQTPTTGATIPVDGGLPDATPR